MSGLDLARQKMKLYQKFRHLMRCKKYFALKCKQTALSQKLSMVKNFLLRYFLHLMRCLNFWESIIFWGAKSGPLSHASAVNQYILLKIYVLRALIQGEAPIYIKKGLIYYILIVYCRLEFTRESYLDFFPETQLLFWSSLSYKGRAQYLDAKIW